MNLSKSILSPLILSAKVVHMHEQKVKYICRYASLVIFAVEDRAPLIVMRYCWSIWEVPEEKPGQRMILTIMPIILRVRVKYRYFSRLLASRSSSQTHFFIGTATRYPKRTTVIVPPPVMASRPRYHYMYRTDTS